ncbi:hypothetical protein EPUS_05691 [Endocarpon pusillum Z07020]|uniref:Fungal N-terminal domain-containing protein n=1 Tax=Endocarpon pusillum (strain Z07020 / HMAS-L-300199) TaxID=1263415 RepID=U1G5P3_ENDPU|nr:uncharacterized protein EPUS_05691 [Endocarpon pusillum Z07020]ERF72637.1 hypothetical protein EPUS_05691 [Endocarpon pusillum Z07020]
MSGAEAIFGVIAGGVSLVSLGIQLSGSAVKLKRMLSTAKNAPQTISQYVSSLETMAAALQLLEHHQQYDAQSGALLARCITAFRESTLRIQQLVDKIEHYMTAYNRVGGKLYTVYKEREVKELFDDLERAKSSLELAYIIYMDAEQRRRHQAHDDTLARNSTLLSDLQAEIRSGNADITQQLRRLLQSPTVPQQGQLVVTDSRIATARELMLRGEAETNPDDMSSSRDDHKQCGRPLAVKQSRRKNRRAHICIRLPSQLYRRVWEFSVTSSQSLWSLHLHTYNIVPENSLIFRYCELGDVAAMQRLTTSGEASLLDTYEEGWRNWTLLEAAALKGQLEVCRYLLNQTDWPDQAAVLSRALSWYVNLNDGKNAVEMYRLFLEAPGFDADLDDTELGYYWLKLCPNTPCLHLILENLHSGFFSLPVEIRFDFVVRVGFHHTDIKPSGFLKCIGLQQSDQRLASLRSINGISVLHYIACHLSWVLRACAGKDELQGWLDLGISVLNNGADPSCIARRKCLWYIDGIYQNIDPHPSSKAKEELESTPLMDALDIKYWQVTDHSRAIIFETMQIWTGMLQQAGFDLRDYGDKESQVWKSLGIEEISKFYQASSYALRVEQLVYGPTPANWSLLVRRPISIYKLKLHPPPGAFPEEPDLPRTIIWNPTDKERDEGHWEFVEERRMQTRYYDLRDGPSASKEPFEELVDCVQDDLGAIMLMHQRASRPRASASRSHSQPRQMNHREVAYDTKQETCGRNSWLGTYHLCPLDSKWRLGLIVSDRIDDEGDLRSCTEGISNERHAVQESWFWQDFSFLGRIARCQDKYREREYDWVWGRLPRSMRHTATQSCPLGCSKVHLDRIQVPEALRDFHPRREYGEDLRVEDDHYEET